MKCISLLFAIYCLLIFVQEGQATTVPVYRRSDSKRRLRNTYKMSSDLLSQIDQGRTIYLKARLGNIRKAPGSTSISGARYGTVYDQARRLDADVVCEQKAPANGDTVNQQIQCMVVVDGMKYDYNELKLSFKQGKLNRNTCVETGETELAQVSLTKKYNGGYLSSGIANFDALGNQSVLNGISPSFYVLLYLADSNSVDQIVACGRFHKASYNTVLDYMNDEACRNNITPFPGIDSEDLKCPGYPTPAVPPTPP